MMDLAKHFGCMPNDPLLEELDYDFLTTISLNHQAAEVAKVQSFMAQVQGMEQGLSKQKR